MSLRLSDTKTRKRGSGLKYKDLIDAFQKYRVAIDADYYEKALLECPICKLKFPTEEAKMKHLASGICQKGKSDYADSLKEAIEKLKEYEKNQPFNPSKR